MGADKTLATDAGLLLEIIFYVYLSLLTLKQTQKAISLAVDEINNNPNFLPNVTLDFEIFGTNLVAAVSIRKRKKKLAKLFI